MTDKPTKEPIYVFLDLETTGLNPVTDTVLELAWVATTAWGDVLYQDSTLGLIRAIPLVNDYVFEMHRQSGLWVDLLKNSQEARQNRDHEDIGDGLTSLALWLSNQDTEKHEFYWAGYSVHFDLSFLDEQYRVQFPKINNVFSHRRMDLSVVKMLAKVEGKGKYQPEPEATHRALDDCFAAIETLKFANNVFHNWYHC